uniref:Uncharacterized protein n=1 Tax=Sparus aurata TaxID=8175 RepID=A0A671WB30_SPAAU
VMQASSPVDSNVCLLFHKFTNRIIRLRTHNFPHTGQLSEPKLTSLHLFAEFDVIIAVILGHLLSAGFPIIEQQVVSHADSVGLHGVGRHRCGLPTLRTVTFCCFYTMKIHCFNLK